MRAKKQHASTEQETGKSWKIVLGAAKTGDGSGRLRGPSENAGRSPYTTVMTMMKNPRTHKKYLKKVAKRIGPIFYRAGAPRGNR